MLAQLEGFAGVAPLAWSHSPATTALAHFDSPELAQAPPPRPAPPRPAPPRPAPPCPARPVAALSWCAASAAAAASLGG